MLTFIIMVIAATIVCWLIETYCKIEEAISTQKSEFSNDFQMLKMEFVEIKEEIQNLGWKIFIPLTPLIALVCLVFWAINHTPN